MQILMINCLLQNSERYGKQTVLVGPWGGQEGHYWDDGVYSTIRQVEVTHGDVIDSIRIEYDINGRSIWSEIHGGSGGAKIDKVSNIWFRAQSIYLSFFVV